MAIENRVARQRMANKSFEMTRLKRDALCKMTKLYRRAERDISLTTMLAPVMMHHDGKSERSYSSTVFLNHWFHSIEYTLE